MSLGTPPGRCIMWPLRRHGGPGGIMKIQILCTLGPASLSAEVIEQLDMAGVDLFRINLSHTRLETLGQCIELVRSASAKPLCLDLEGAQVRCGAMAPGVVLRKGDPVRLTATPVEGNASELSLWPRAVFAALPAGTLITIDFDGAQVRVREADEEHAQAVVVDSGRVGSHKGAIVDPAPVLPALTDKD